MGREEGQDLLPLRGYGLVAVAGSVPDVENDRHGTGNSVRRLFGGLTG
ncbi:hypothetical protein [Frankia sp. Cj5]|nr:hypothetical protein [Frankia sp. Cj5]